MTVHQQTSQHKAPEPKIITLNFGEIALRHSLPQITCYVVVDELELAEERLLALATSLANNFQMCGPKQISFKCPT